MHVSEDTGDSETQHSLLGAARTGSFRTAQTLPP